MVTTDRNRHKLVYALVPVISFVIILTRRPGSILNPQFWAEDGKVWYADAYNNGWMYSLLTPEAGYYQTFSRLVALITQPFAFSSAPLLFNLAAIAIQIVVALFIVSPRFATIIADLRWRVVLALVYIALPHSHEVIANVTNSQWHLALLSLFVIVTQPRSEKNWKVFDVVVISISAVSGPFCVLLLPIAAIKYWQIRDRWTLILTSILGLAVIAQAASLLTHERPSQASLGASVEGFLTIAGRHLFASPIMGGKAFGSFAARTGLGEELAVVAALAGFAFLAYAAVKVDSRIRLLILFSLMIFAAALISPAVSPSEPQWEAIAKYDTALRYWLIPNFTLFVILVFFASTDRYSQMRRISLLILFASIFGIVTDWKNPPMADLNFRDHAETFETAAPGTVVEIPINPPPHWKMTLVKKP